MHFWCIYLHLELSPLDGPILSHLEILQLVPLMASFQNSLAFHFTLKNIYGFLDIS